MKHVEVAVEAAKIAGAAIQSSNGVDLNILEKDSSRTSIVTAADLCSQQEVIRTIRRAFPHDLIVGEEGSDGSSTSPSRWYVDPLDGTTNYAHQLRHPRRRAHGRGGRRTCHHVCRTAASDGREG
jgi:myo-inositol-1(or 4)-monophosphatase